MDIHGIIIMAVGIFGLSLLLLLYFSYYFMGTINHVIEVNVVKRLRIF